MSASPLDGSESDDSWPWAESMSSATPSEDSQDREFVISDSESLSLRCDSPSETMAVHFPISPKGQMKPIKVIARRTNKPDSCPSTEYLVLWYSWEVADEALRSVEGRSQT
ncbi:hypothetical protein LV156_008754 [Aspergillus fumigatus]|nr:hypothetical protein LV156_008754 [Aspergillus fumigatus]